MGINSIALSKEKKISFKYYLDTRRPSDVTEGFYPLYVQVIFNQKNTRLKAVIDHEEEHYWREEDLEKFLENDFTGKYRGEAYEVLNSQKLIEEIIRYEYSLKGEEYSLRGLGDRLKIYRSNITVNIQRDLFEAFLLEVKHFNLSIDLPRSSSFAKNYYSGKELLGKSYSVSQVVSRQIELYVALTLYSDATFAGDFGEENSWMMYHWLRAGSKKAFSVFISKLIDKAPELSFNNIPNQGTFVPYRKLVDDFFPKQDYLQYYLFLIDNQVYKAENRLRW